MLWEENSQNQRSIASITKVMTAVVFLENSPDLSQEVVVTREDVHRASVTYLRAGYKISTRDLLHLLLIASDNAASRTLARDDVGRRSVSSAWRASRGSSRGTKSPGTVSIMARNREAT